MMVFGVTRVSASSADIVISSDKEIYTKGDYVDIYIDIEAEVLPGDFEGYLLYSPDILEYVSGPELATGGEGIIKLSDSVSSSTRNTRRYSLRFKAVSTGESTVTLRETPELYEFEEGYLMSVSVNEMVVKVEAAKNASSDNSLSVLKISPGVLSLGFSKSRREYETTVEEDVEKLVVSAAVSDVNADVDVSGGKKLEYGENRIEIKVTAENGESTVYIIKCFRKGKQGDNEDNRDDITDEDDTGSNPEENSDNPTGPAGREDQENGEIKSGIKAVNDGNTVRIFTDNEYELVTDVSDIEIPDGYSKTSMVIDGITIPVYFNDESDGLMLLVLKNSNGKTALYNYDRTEKTIQRYMEKNTETTVKHVMTDSIEALELANSYEKSLSTMTLIIAVLSGISMALLIVVIRMTLKNRGDGNDL
jgi:hypothetical protein